MDDPFLWLEEVAGERPLSWVREHNAAAEALLCARPEFGDLQAQVREVLDSSDRIPHVRRIGDHLYNLWTDAQHPRGLWRRTTLAGYRQADPQWETVIDLDALGRAEGVSWVWGGATCEPARDARAVTRCMVALSRGGSDAQVQREFDLAACRFVAGGFELPEAKGWLGWVDRDTLYVASDFGPGSLTTSGYPRMVKQWRRGTALAHAPTVFEGDENDVLVEFTIDAAPGFERHIFHRMVDFFTRERFLLQEGGLVRIEAPADAAVMTHRDLLLLQLRSEYAPGDRRFPAGTLLATEFAAFMRGERRFDVLFEPTATRAIERDGIGFTRSRVVLRVADDVTNRLEELWREAGGWQRRSIDTPGAGTAWVTPLHDPALADDPLAEHYLMGYEDFLTPDSLHLGRGGSGERELLKQRPALFDARGMRVEQGFASSRDGTRVPYFVVWPKDAAFSGDNPTLLYGYGGYQRSELPGYAPAVARAWLTRGGAYVVANVRGGGEFGPEWHRAAMKERKQRSYDDFIAVAEDLVARRITSPRHLGMMGGSNGGLLVGAVLTQRPDLFNAAVCVAPLLDMKRFHKLLAGASWIAEYGDPDVPEEWAYISRYSPYHQLRTGVSYPQVLFLTSTRDDRVHPGHARKMAARMEALGHPVLYYENIEGGHGVAADAAQRARIQALSFSYLWMRLGRPAPAGG